MMGYDTVLNSRESADGLGWVVDATWTDRSAEQLVGLFNSGKRRATGSKRVLNVGDCSSRTSGRRSRGYRSVKAKRPRG